MKARWICECCGNEIDTASTGAVGRSRRLRVTCHRCGADSFVPVACCNAPGGDPVCVLASGHDGGHDHGHGKGSR